MIWSQVFIMFKLKTMASIRRSRCHQKEKLGSLWGGHEVWVLSVILGHRDKDYSLVVDSTSVMKRGMENWTLSLDKFSSLMYLLIYQISLLVYAGCWGSVGNCEPSPSLWVKWATTVEGTHSDLALWGSLLLLPGGWLGFGKGSHATYDGCSD